MGIQIRSHGGDLLAQAVQSAYLAGQTDYGLEPLVRVGPDGCPVGRISAGDGVIFCCRRGEREIELTEAFVDPGFAHFPRQLLHDLNFVILTLYHEKFKHLPVAFAPSKLADTLGEVVSRAGLRQLHCAESEKYAHITFFLNGGNSQPFAGETDCRISSPRGIPFDQVPELSLPKVVDEVIQGIETGYDLIVVNFANGDVIGHTASPEAKIRCAQSVDHHLGRVVRSAAECGYVVLVTADHGNLEEMLTADGKPHVAHTTNPVPLIVIDPCACSPLQVADGSLRDVAPTILQILDIKPPAAMNGMSLVKDVAGRRVLLVILDGWGNSKADETNPIFLAPTPNWDALTQMYPLAQLHASGEAVGLQPGKAGNSEAGHMNIGAGRVVLQDDVRLDRAMQDGSFFKNEIFLATIDAVIERKTNLHLIGLLTEKSSHGSIDYPLALLTLAKQRGLERVFLHLIFDGRSSEPGSVPALLDHLEGRMAAIGVGQIVTGVGRGLALDRDGNYTKIRRAYEALTLGTGQRYG